MGDPFSWLLAFSIAILLVLLALTIVVALYHFGLFHPIEVNTGQSPFKFEEKSIIYRIGYGSYANSSTIFTELCSILPTTSNITTFGIYLPNGLFTESIREQLNQLLPQAEQPEFAYCIGIVLDSEDKKLDKQTLELLKQNGYLHGKFPRQPENVVYSKFPFRGNISVVVGSRRVYSAIHDYIEEHRLCAYPKIEIYNGDQIYYILPLSNQDGFVSLISTGLSSLYSSTGSAAVAAPVETDDSGDSNQQQPSENEKEEDEGDVESDVSNSSYEILDN